MSRLARRERMNLCDLLAELGPDQPTLCEGWRTRDLAAHLIVRESRPDAIPGIMLAPLSSWTQRVQDGIAGGDFRRLVHRLRTGPPFWSPFRPPRVDEAANGIEFFIHHEDVRRAQPAWAPRELDAETSDLLWRRARFMARRQWRHKSRGVALVWVGADERVVARVAPPGAPTDTLTGTPSELAMWLFGRRDHARVEAHVD